MDMARYRGRKSLYEVMGETKSKPKRRSILERLRPAVDMLKTARPARPKVAPKAKPPRPAEPAKLPPKERQQVWRGPRAVQLNVGRIEISIPYPIAIAAALGVVLIVLVAFRLGQIDQKASTAIPQAGQPEQTPPPQPAPDSARQGPNPWIEPTGSGATGPTASAGDHVIVIAGYGRHADLEPVRQHFAEFGIATRIVQQGDRYLLITQNRYSNPQKPGTDGHVAKQRIIEVGAKYRGRAPAGYEPFAPHYFKDAYGMKVD